MRKKLAVVMLCCLLPISSNAATTTTTTTPEARAFRLGLEKGIEVGIKFSRDTIKQELAQYWDLVDSAFNYHYLFLKGEVPPPLVLEKTVVRKDGGIAKIERELNILPPAYFPVDRIEALKTSLSSTPITIQSGYVIYLDTKTMPLVDIAYTQYLAETDNFEPIYIDSRNMIVFGSYQRRADALAQKKELEKIGISNVRVVKLDKDLVIKVPQDKKLADEIKELAQKIIEKEKKLAGVETHSFKRGLSGVLFYLQKAQALVDTINQQKYPDFASARLREDINRIVIEVNKYLSERQPYAAVFTIQKGDKPLTSAEKPVESSKLKKAQQNIQEIEKLLRGE